MLTLTDLLTAAKVKLRRFKIHCATGQPNPPLDAFFNGTFKQWQEYQNNRNFNCDQIVSLINLHADKWLFAGLWNVEGVTPKSNPAKSWFEYSTAEVPGLEHLTGRTIVSFKRNFRASYIHGHRYAGQIVVDQILAQRMSMGEFPGFSSVLLTHDQLRHIVDQSLASWRAALKSVAGVYLVTDRSCGKHYVGSAYGAEGIWGRWRLYADAGHGNNAGLRKLLDGKPGHGTHFQFSILEICDPLTSKDDVLAREVHWKKVIGSREFGYNAN